MTERRDRWTAAGILATWTLLALWLRHGIWAQDLSALYVAARAWDMGLFDLIYSAQHGFLGGTVDLWIPGWDAPWPEGATTYPYLYPPLWAAALAPLTRGMDVTGFIDAVSFVHIPLLALSVLLAGRLAKPAAMRWSLWAAWGVAVLTLSSAAMQALWQNQPSITTGFLVLLALDRMRLERPAQAGAFLAVAAAIKITPLAFVLVFLAVRSPRAIAAFALTGAALAGVSLLVAGWPLHRAFLDSLDAASASTTLSPANVSLKSALLELGVAVGWLADPMRGTATITAPVWLGPPLMLIGAALATYVAWRARRALPHADAIRHSAFAVAVVLPLFGPMGWLHYYLIPLFLLPGLVSARAARLPALLATLGSLFVPYIVLHTLIPGLQSVSVPVLALLWLWVMMATLPPERAVAQPV